MKTFISAGVLITCIVYAVSGYAAWQGPVEVVSGRWGNGPGQFGFASGDPLDKFPKDFVVDKFGNIIIADSLNKRLQIFKKSGEKIAFGFKNINVDWNILEWPNEKSMDVTGNAIIVEGPGGFQYYDYQGNIVAQFDVPDCYLRGANDDGSLILLCKNKIYYKYSAAGKLLETYSGEPLSLGIINEEHLGNNNFGISVKYENATYSIKADKTFEYYRRDARGFVYAISGLAVERYSKCGKLTAQLVPPSSTIFYGDKKPDKEQHVFIHDEYGDAVLDSYGNVYTWKRTPSNYSILKWTWVDDSKASPEPCPEGEETSR